MECNKEEAIRAKGIAEKKMESEDFVGARKIALKAEKLYHELDNIPQMIKVCDVHVSAENKVHGNERDWYAILNIEPTADDKAIKKQYREFALLLHPDKNKFAGAADAFKLVEQARRLLLDPLKRNLYDRNYFAPNGGTSGGHHDFVKKYNSPHQPQQEDPSTQQEDPSVFHRRKPTFWTQCPSCFVKFQYYANMLNILIKCHSCKSSFSCIEIEYQGGTHMSQQEVPNPGSSKVGPEPTFKKPTPREGCQGNVSRRESTGPIPKEESTSNASERDADVEFDIHNHAQTKYCEANGKRKRTVEIDENDASSPLEKPEESSQETSHPKKSKHDKSSAKMSTSKKRKQDESAPKKSHGDSTEPETYEYTDPDFSNFDKCREEDCFAAGQVWAIYDDMGGMPRYYACIRRVFSRGFKVHITWLKSDSLDENEIKWSNEGLPVSCGKFKHGESLDTEQYRMFSHPIAWEEASTSDAFMIYPRKGQVWALFKNWDINWYSDPNRKREFEFEFVEVLSHYEGGVGVRVEYLSKAKGFASLFCRNKKEGVDSALIPPNEILRFSHMIPSFQMSGGEREDVPKGSFELDPACLPANLEGVDIPKNVNVEGENIQRTTKDDGNGHIGYEDPKSDIESEKLAEVYEIADPEFYNFDADKSREMFQVGQIWALYCDEDTLPKYYGRIKKIDSLLEFKLHLEWFWKAAPPNDVIMWHNSKMPVSCGWFELKKGEKLEQYTDTSSFSHQIRAEPTDKKNIYAILPRKGEVWALYYRWDAKMKYSKLKKCEYDIVEILEENETWTSVLTLELVGGHMSVFKPQMEGESSVMTKIPRSQLFKFSHQIPAFRLTEERGGSLRGFWELDPACLPANLAGVEIPRNVKAEDEDEDEEEITQESDTDSGNLSEAYVIPYAEFYNFDADKSRAKFQTGQTWALYSDEDILPKYYGRIKKIDSPPEFKLHLEWFWKATPPNDVIMWHDSEMPVSCGWFELRKGEKIEQYTDPLVFSHQITAVATDKKNVFLILPRKGEVWALFKKWSAEMKCSDLSKCEYEVVEILEEKDMCITVWSLEVVDGHKSVFKPQLEGQSYVVTKILRSELFTFSHRIPAFRLTEEKSGSLKGFWALDPAALPAKLFRT